LKNTDDDQQDRRKPARSGIGGQQADEGSGAAHDGKRDQKGIFAANQIADATKEQCAERPHEEAHGKRGEISDISKGVVARGVEFQSQHGRKAAENIEVIPFDHGSDSGRQNHSPNAVSTCAVDYCCSCLSRHNRGSLFSLCAQGKQPRKYTWLIVLARYLSASSVF
jgi:hypothetical protein